MSYYNCISCDKKIKRPANYSGILICLKCKDKCKIKISKCLHCNNEIPAHNSSRRKNKYCSISCSSTHNQTGKTHTEETKQKISLNVTLNSPGFTGVKFYSLFNPYLNKEIKLQGTWEYKYGIWLNANKINWIKDKSHRLEYYNKLGNKRNYYPDFYLIDTNEYIEIKGVWWYDDKIKMDAVYLNNPKIKITVLMSDELKALGINIFDYSDIPNYSK